MPKKYKEKGITLIALVVTIIVLLILAAVSIAMLVGDNGILSNAKESQITTEKSKAREKLEIILEELQISKNIVSDYNNGYINKKFEEEEIDIIEEDIAIVDGWQFEINIEQLKIEKDLDKLSKEEIYNLRMPKIQGELVVETTQIQTLIALEKTKETIITYTIKKAETKEEIESITGTNKLDHTSTELEEGQEYEIVISAKNKYGEKTKTKNVKTLLSKVPPLTQNSSNIIQQNFLDNYSDMWGTSMFFHAFDKNDGTYVGTTNTHISSIGSNIGYDFEKPIRITHVTGKIRMLSYKIQYSDDLNQWNDVLTSNNAASDNGDNFYNEIDSTIGAHRAWRLYVNGGQNASNRGALVYSLQFYGEMQEEHIEIK